MYIIISIFAAYALGIISYEYNFFNYIFICFFVLLSYSSVKNKNYVYGGVIMLFLILAYFNCSYNEKSVLKQYKDDKIQVTAEIISSNKSDDKSLYNSFNAYITHVNGIRINNEGTILYVDKSKNIKPNTIMSATVSVSDVKFNKNNILFSYEKYLRSKRVFTSMFVTSDVNVLQTDYSFANSIVIKFREYAENLFRTLLDEDSANIMLSILLGNKSFMDANIYDNVKDMGLAHIFAVSGLHIGLLYGALLWAFKTVGVGHKLSWMATWIILWCYGFLIGFPVSVLRTLVMFTALFGSELLYRKYNSFNSIALSATVLLVINPFWLFEAGFQLSFAATLCIVIFNRYLRDNFKKTDKLSQTLAMYVFLQIGTVPISAYCFNYLPVGAIVYNLLFIPLFTVILTVGFVILLFGHILFYTIYIPAQILNYVLFTTIYLTDIVGGFALNGIITNSFSIWESVFFYITVVFSIYVYVNKNTKCKNVGYLILFSFFMLNYIMLPMSDDSLYFSVIDVGQGSSNVIEYKNHKFVYDCGSTDKNAGQYTIGPYMLKNGIDNISCLFVSHWDADHYSGIYDVAGNAKINHVFSSEENDDIKIKKEILKKGDLISVDKNLKLEVLWPDKNFITDKRNDTSLVVEVTYKDKKILLMGDIEELVENQISDNLNKANIVVVPHHGSKTSSTDKFVNNVKPEYAVMSYGKNSYGIPDKMVIDRYKNVNSVIMSTFDDGEINFVLKDGEIYYNTYSGNKSSNYWKLYTVNAEYNLMLFAVMLKYIFVFRNKINNGENHEL